MPVVIVNREMIDWIGPAREEDLLRPTVAPAAGSGHMDVSIDDRLRERLAAYRGKWVALAPPSGIPASGDSPSEAYAAGQAAGEGTPAILRVPG